MPYLSEDERKLLLALARQAIISAVRHEPPPQPLPIEGIIAERRGVFVTLHLYGELRGCIGVTESSEAVAQTVVRCAASAALRDPRFPPLRPVHLADVHIEISILSPPVPILPEQIVVGRHGLHVRRGAQRGLLLPQVAVEHGMSRDVFLEQTCRKAGLLGDAWRDAETEIWGFTCEVFAEMDAQP
ncbi:MAG: AmmeMemoRadiSam system protein A [Acidobacteriia bacterium]|nr:AmmeMemoRadiSam system protein A [Terriglobia bacterium]